MTTTVEIYVDYVCPYCFLVEDAVKALQRDRDIEVVIRPFELRPDPVPTLRPEDEYLPRVWEGSVYPMARELGVDIVLPTISPQPRTELAFIVLQVAEERGVAQEYSTAVFQAFFQHNRNISDESVLLDIAASVGLDPHEVATALHSAERRERQQAAQHHATETVGVHAVPSFLVHGRLLSGVLDVSSLRKAVDSATAVGNRS
ncbi:DsbA family protein [Nocardia sp. 004]|uniref:DsbA family oxidoreductase n=1 Tax=Nocardia sp. 004 TaxID=3385978 RepID=UPI0039A324EE